jgi:predicted PurR-regulated permease PerM
LPARGGALLDINRRRAAVLIVLLALGIAVALFPYATGLLAAPVLYVVVEPAHSWLAKRLSPSASAVVVILVLILAALTPAVWLAGPLVTEAQHVGNTVLHSPALAALAMLRVGDWDVGAPLADLGSRVMAWVGSSAPQFVGTALRLALNGAVSLFGLYYLLLRPGDVWNALRPYLPFSPEHAERLRLRFHAVTVSMVVGTGFHALYQGVLVALGFWVVGLPDVVFWGAVTAVLSILPVVGSGLVWVPGGLALAIEGHLGAGMALVIWGFFVASSVDYVVRPLIVRHWANIHPLITVVGALAGVEHFGLLGLILGPLALSYLFELVRMYHEEYLTA